MKKQHLIPTAVLSAFLLATSPALADSPIADVNLSSAGVDFSMNSSLGGSLSLTVSGPADYHFQQDFKSGQTPYFSTFDKAGDSLQAGTYTWTLTHNPVASGDRAQAVASKALRQTGHFTVEAGGSIANPDLIEGGFDKAQTFATDLIVQGSGCIGIDCASSESFGFDTLRLKENNLRIHFDDTSASASFPGNDWRLTANDSGNGGANYFAIEDATAGRQVFKVEAGAIVNALYVDAEGDVGVGTANPVVEVHAVDGNSPTFRLEQDGSSGFTPQTWDLAGNETNFFIRDVTNGSKLPFRIEPGAADNAIYIDSTNNIGMGTNNPSDELHIRRTDDTSTKILVENANAGAETVGVDMTSAVGSYSTRVVNSGDFAIRNLLTGNNVTVTAAGAMTLPALDTAPAACTNGSLYNDSSGALCVCFSATWSVLAGSGSCS